MHPYEQEIREYLLARLEKRHGTAALGTPLEDVLPTRRITDWWIFEGKRYPGLTNSLAHEWPRVVRHVEALSRTYNPRWRAVQIPEGEVDWIATALATATSVAPEYVCRASRIGLTTEERRALLEWCSWVARRWNQYRAAVSIEFGGEVPWHEAEEDPSELQVRRWALIARRSRWPLLRNIVAETLRVMFEPALLDKVPLPSDSAVLFEMLCLVRLLRTLAPFSGVLRWLDLEASRNEVAIEGLRCRYQHSYKQEEVFATTEYDRALIAATERHGLRVHRDIDVLVEFSKPRAGFTGIVLEAKSGQQSYDEAVAQLKHYRAIVRRWHGGRWLILGVRELDEAEAVTKAALEAAITERDTVDEDVWFFCPATAIPTVLRGLGLAQS